MMVRELENEYFEWLVNMVCRDKFAKEISFRKLLMHLHRREFTYTIPNDKNRASDGVKLRRRFFLDCCMDDNSEYFDWPCSVLEMMIALAIRCEETIMDDPRFGDRTSHWFWCMVVNIGLGSMTDDFYDKRTVNEAIDILLERRYAPNGKGGLFKVRNCNDDLRDVEIWYQLCWYLDRLI